MYQLLLWKIKWQKNSLFKNQKGTKQDKPELFAKIKKSVMHDN